MATHLPRSKDEQIKHLQKYKEQHFNWQTKYYKLKKRITALNKEIKRLEGLVGKYSRPFKVQEKTLNLKRHSKSPMQLLDDFLSFGD